MIFDPWGIKIEMDDDVSISLKKKPLESGILLLCEKSLCRRGCYTHPFNENDDWANKLLIHIDV